MKSAREPLLDSGCEFEKVWNAKVSISLPTGI